MAVRFEVVVRALDERFDSIYAEKTIRVGEAADSGFRADLVAEIDRMVDGVADRVEEMDYPE